MLLRIGMFCVVAGVALAQLPGQLPGQYPGQGRPPIGGIPGTYPPGTYPPGTYPPTPPGTTYPPTLPLPGPTPRTSPSRGPTISSPAYVQTFTFTGVVRRFTPKVLIIEADDHRIVWFQRADDFKVTDIKAAGMAEERFTPGNHVIVDAAQDEEGFYRASLMRWVKEGTTEERAMALLDWDMPTDAQLPKDARDDRPVIRRGGRAPKAEPPEEPQRAAKAADRPAPAPIAERNDDPSIARAREAALTFIETLPSFAARQSTTRYVRMTAASDWVAQDVVTANLVFKDGEEIYSDIRVGRDRLAGLLEDIKGFRSTGEFGTLLEELFDPATSTSFLRGSEDTIGGRRAVRFTFAVPRDRSNLRIHAPSESYISAYRGTVWVDVETDRVLRLEEQATGLPAAFPFDRMEMAVDYEFVRLETRVFLLPVEAQALDCIRATTVCMRNQTSFRNYVKYEAESGIVFEK